ncbi:MAG: hypothetical protein ACTS6G_00550 [Candidatus Hodgkinia cicadicola]
MSLIAKQVTFKLRLQIVNRLQTKCSWPKVILNKAALLGFALLSPPLPCGN